MVNALGDYSKTLELKCNRINQLTQYYGTVSTPIEIGGIGLTVAFIPGVYRYVFNAFSGGVVLGLGGALITFTGLPADCTMNVSQLNNGLVGFTSVGSAYLTSQVVNFNGTSAVINITANFTTAGYIYYKLVVNIFNETQ